MTTEPLAQRDDPILEPESLDRDRRSAGRCPGSRSRFAAVGIFVAGAFSLLGLGSVSRPGPWTAPPGPLGPAPAGRHDAASVPRPAAAGRPARDGDRLRTDQPSLWRSAEDAGSSDWSPEDEWPAGDLHPWRQGRALPPRDRRKMVELAAMPLGLSVVPGLADVVHAGAKREDGFKELSVAPPSEVQISYAVPPAKMDPLVFDLDRDGVRASTRKVRFDLDGDNRYERFHDMASGDGLLVFDADRDGVSGDSGREVFGDTADVDGDGRPDGFRDGFEALLGLARHAARESVIPRSCLEEGRLGPRDIVALERAYGLRMRLGSFGGRAVLLREAGVAGVALSAAESVAEDDFDGQGNTAARREGAVFTRPDGSVGSYEALWLGASKQSFRKYAWR